MRRGVGEKASSERCHSIWNRVGKQEGMQSLNHEFRLSKFWLLGTKLFSPDSASESITSAGMNAELLAGSFSLVINTSAIHFCLRALSLPLLPSQPLSDLSKQWHLQDYFLKITFLGLSSLRLGPSCTMTPLQSGNKKAHIKQKEEAPVSGSSARHQINVFFNTLESGNYLTHQRAWCE